MSEPFGNPNKFQIAKAQKLYGDPLLHWATNKAIEALNAIKKEGVGDFTNLQFREWKRLTRLMFLNIPAIFVIEETYKISEEIAKNTWEDFEVPDLTKEIKKISIDPDATLLKDKIKITDIAKKYGLNKTKGGNWECPFHNSSGKNSLSLSDEKGLFNCFGCNVTGDLITFYKKLKELKNEKESS